MRALMTIYTIWLREVTRFVRERSRIVGMIGQPLLYLLIVGVGIRSGMQFSGSSGGIDYLKYMYPGIIGMSVLFTSIFSAVSIIWDREFGFLKEVLVAPVPRWAVAVGKVLGGSTVAMLQSVILIALAPLVGVALSPLIVLGMLVLCFLMSFAVTSLGVLIAARMHSMEGFQMLMNFLVMPIYFLSGAMFPVKSAPGWMQTLMTLDPLMYGVDALRNVICSGTVIGSESLAAVMRDNDLILWALPVDVAVLLTVALALVGLASFSFSRAE
jgi:ABC-2 type transport system permease protein